MKAPKDHWIIQIEVTNACIHNCSNCTRLCGHHKKPFFMDYETFCRAVDSVIDHPGMIGIMGGEPTLHPRFTDLCQYLYKKLPSDRLPAPGTLRLPTDSFIEVRRKQELGEYEIQEYGDCPRPVIRGAGLFTTITPAYVKNYEIIQDVFKFQNLNDHTNASYHQPVLISRKDMGIDDKHWLKLREKCWVNRLWSSSITPKGCFFCEIAAAMDMLYDGPGGLPIEKNWWKRDIEDFREQFRWCELCGIPLKTFSRDAREGILDVSAENAALLQTKTTAQYHPSRLNIVKIEDGKIAEDSKKAAPYHGVSYIKNAQERISDKTQIFCGGFTGVLLCGSEDEERQCSERLRNNLKYLNELYVVINGCVVKKAENCGEGTVHYEKKVLLKDFLMQREPGQYFLFLTPEIELGDGFEKLRESVVNPGTLHMIDFVQEKNGESPYVRNAAELHSGLCALLNNNAKSLKEIKEDPALDAAGLRTIWKNWPVEKRVKLSDEMDSLMLDVGDPKSRKRNRRRRISDGEYLLKRWIRQYGVFQTGKYGVQIINQYGIKWVISRIRARIF